MSTKRTPSAREALQAVWDFGDQLDSNHTRWAAFQVAERMGITIEAHNRFSEPPRNRNEEQRDELQAEIERLLAEIRMERGSEG